MEGIAPMGGFKKQLDAYIFPPLILVYSAIYSSHVFKN
jgi:hypothetical protein